MTPEQRGLMAGLVVLAAVAVTATLAADDETAREDLTVGWSQGADPACVYDARRRSVEATLQVEGMAPRPTTLTVTVTAHADENTSQPVGWATSRVDVEGEVDERLVLAFPVDAPPYVDIDGVTACSLDVAD